MPEELQPGEAEANEELNQPVENPYPLSAITAPEIATDHVTEPLPELYPQPESADAVERMKILAMDLAQLKYEQKQSDDEEGYAELIEAAETELATLNSYPEVRQAYQEFFHQLVVTVKEVSKLSRIDHKINSLNSQVKKTSRRHSTGLISSYVRRHLQSLEQEIVDLRQESEEILADPETELGWRNHQLREYRRQINEPNHFVETPSRREYINKLQDLWEDGKKVLVTGPTGTGKTELAKIASDQYAGKTGAEDYIISGHQGLTTYEVYGKPKLGPGTMTEVELTLWEQKIRSAEDQGQQQFLLAQFQRQGGIVSGFTLGKLPRAAEDGRVVIYDEIDLIPSKTLLRHKADFNLRAGQSLTIQEDSDQLIKIKEGFAVTATANLKSAKHKERDEIDPAILRLMEPLPIGYFPKDELYDLCLARLIDRRGALQMSQQDAEMTLAQLVSAATDIQEAYLGKATKFYQKGGGSTGKVAFLDKAVLDPGRLLGLLVGYQREALRGTSFKSFVEQGLIDFVNNEAYTDKERFTLLDIFTQHGFLLNRAVNDFLPADLNAAEWQKHIEGKTAVTDHEPTYLDPRAVAALDPFGLRQTHVSESAEEFLAQAVSQAIGTEAVPSANTELETSLELPRQYAEIVKALTESEMIEPLANGELGIKAIDGQEYQLPSYAEIAQELASRPELKAKIDQGFSKLLIVPFGRSLDELCEKYKAALDRFSDQLHTTNGDQLKIGANGSLGKWGGYNNADVTDKIVYQPTKFERNKHGGKTKSQLMSTQLGEAFRVWLVENLPDLPAENAGQTINGREQLGANSSSGQYLETLQTDPVYENEAGLAPEDYLAWATNEVVIRQLVVDDKMWACLPGGYFPADGSVPFASWSRDDGQAYLYGCSPVYHGPSFGVRVGVRVI